MTLEQMKQKQLQLRRRFTRLCEGLFKDSHKTRILAISIQDTLIALGDVGQDIRELETNTRTPVLE